MPNYLRVFMPYSTFHKYVEQGVYLPNGCGDINIAVADDNNMRPITLMLIGPTVLINVLVSN